MITVSEGIDGTRYTGMGSVLRRYREERRLTQRELAAAAGLSLGALRDLEQGRTQSPRWDTAERLATALGLGPGQRAELTRAYPGSSGRPVPGAPDRGAPGRAGAAARGSRCSARWPPG